MQFTVYIQSKNGEGIFFSLMIASICGFLVWGRGKKVKQILLGTHVRENELQRVEQSAAGHSNNAAGRIEGIYLVLNVLPDDPGHLIAVQLDDGSLDLDLLEARHLPALTK